MSGINKSTSVWLRDPKLARAGETIGGGYFVFRRGDGTKRIRPSQWPFEHESEEAAKAQAEILASQHPGYQFDVVKVIASTAVSAASAEAAE